MDGREEGELHFKIGEVAEMFDISIRALRLYDKMGLFKPGHVDAQNAYRYYTADQMPVLNTILVLKGIGFRLVEIRDLEVHGFAPELLLAQLDRKHESIENEMEIARFNLENVEKIREAVLVHIDKLDSMDADKTSTSMSKEKKERTAVDPEAYKMSRLICLENLKIDIVLSEVLWL